MMLSSAVFCCCDFRATGLNDSLDLGLWLVVSLVRVRIVRIDPGKVNPGLSSRDSDEYEIEK